jgi:hypothetical protein
MQDHDKDLTDQADKFGFAGEVVLNWSVTGETVYQIVSGTGTGVTDRIAIIEKL